MGPSLLEGFDAVVHLAAHLQRSARRPPPRHHLEINHLAAVSLAEAAKQAGVGRFVFSSSCSLYGAQGDAPIDETAPFNPVTPYGRSKVLAEAGIGALADDEFSPGVPAQRHCVRVVPAAAR